MEDKMVELTRFVQVSEAEMLASLLKSEGVDCYVRDNFISEIYKGVVDLGGAKVELLEKDLQRATEIMKVYGYAVSETEETMEGDEPGETGDDEVTENVVETEETGQSVLDESERNKTKLSRIMLVFLILILLLLGCIIVMNKYLNG